MGNVSSGEAVGKGRQYLERAGTAARNLGSCITRDTGSHTDDMLKCDPPKPPLPSTICALYSNCTTSWWSRTEHESARDMRMGVHRWLCLRSKHGGFAGGMYGKCMPDRWWLGVAGSQGNILMFAAAMVVIVADDPFCRPLQRAWRAGGPARA